MDPAPSTGRQLRIQINKQELLRLLLTGLSLKECGAALHVSKNAIWRYAADPIFQAELRSLSAELYSRIDSELISRKVEYHIKLEEASDEALDTLIEIMQSGASETNRLKAAQDLLDRDGRMPKIQKIESESTHRILDAELLRVAAQTAREMDKIVPEGQILDLQPPKALPPPVEGPAGAANERVQ